MGLNLKDEETVALVTEVAKKLGMTKTGVVRELARDKLAELGRSSEAHGATRRRDIDDWLEREVWPHAPADEVTKAELEEILGYDEMFRE